MIGILGGTFDPVHYGHLRPALELLEQLPLEQIRWIPSGQPPHRQSPLASAGQRRQMVAVAISDQPGFVLDDRELRRAGPSYMVDTLQSLRDDFPAGHVCLILGIDAFLLLHTWHQWERIAELSHLVVTHRPGWSDADLQAAPAPVRQLLAARRVADADGLRQAAAGRILLQPVTQLDISATRIRELRAAGRSVRYLVPEPVLSLMNQWQLYGV